MQTDRAQTELWAHIQTARRNAFLMSKSRLESMVRIAGKPPKGGALLNIGCGDGYLEIEALRKGWSVISVDPDSVSVNFLKEAGVDARCGLIQLLPVASESVDVVVCTEVFEHLLPEAMDVGLREIERVLKPGGRLIGTVPYRENLSLNDVFCPHCRTSFHRWGHHQSFDQASMASRLEQRLQVIKVMPTLFPTWNTLNWKGKLIWAGQTLFSWFGIFGASANLLFVALKDGDQRPASLGSDV